MMGTLLADEAGLEKSIDSGLVLLQKPLESGWPNLRRDL